VKRLLQLVLRGLVVTVPLVVTIYIIWWMAVSAEQLLGPLIRAVLPEPGPIPYVPGLGVLAGVLVVLVLGGLSYSVVFRRLYRAIDATAGRVPLVGSIYGGLKDLMDFLSHSASADESLGKVVAVEIAEGQRLIGFLTQEQPKFIPEGLAPGVDDPVAVYLPMSYQLGGFTVFMPRSKVTDVDLGPEEAMRFALTAAMTKRPSESTSEPSAQQPASQGRET
jgi:uncharacterized membrane protein